jgi:hypothetical protein
MKLRNNMKTGTNQLVKYLQWKTKPQIIHRKGNIYYYT